MYVVVLTIVSLFINLFLLVLCLFIHLVFFVVFFVKPLLCSYCDTCWNPLENEMVHLKGFYPNKQT